MARNAWSTLRFGSRMSSSEAVEPAAADAVELRPDLRPLAAELVADAAVLLEDRGRPPRADASATRRKSARRRSMQRASSFWSAGGRPASSVLSRSSSRRRIRLLERDGDRLLLEQPRRGLAGRDRVQERLGAVAAAGQPRGDRRLEPARRDGQRLDQDAACASGRPLAASRSGGRSRGARSARRRRAGRPASSGLVAARVDRRQRRQRGRALRRRRRGRAPRQLAQLRLDFLSWRPLASSIPRSISPASFESRSDSRMLDGQRVHRRRRAASRAPGSPDGSP